MTILCRLILGGSLVLAPVALAPATQAQENASVLAQEPTWRPLQLAADELLGFVDPGEILVSALEVEPEVATFAVDLGNGVIFEGTVDRVQGFLSLRLSDALGSPHLIDTADLELLARAYHALALQPELAEQPAADLLIRYLNWIADAPPGTTIDLQTSLPAKTAATSLCKKVGKNVTAYWDHITGSSSKAYRLGPCAQGACMGRCGQGCGGDPGPSYAIQQFTQDCLNHDGCVEALGYASPSCQDEFAATADDVAIARDCNAIAGLWKIKYKTNPKVTNRSARFTMKKNGTFKGSVHVSAGRYVSLRGKREDPPPLLKKTAIKVPLWMSSACSHRTLGFAKATLKGTNYCGKIRARLTNGTWNTYRNCQMSTPHGWTGQVVLKRKKW